MVVTSAGTALQNAELGRRAIAERGFAKAEAAIKEKAAALVEELVRQRAKSR